MISDAPCLISGRNVHLINYFKFAVLYQHIQHSLFAQTEPLDGSM